ncbi:peroxiredoxin-5, mitochondrial-like [Spodoptera frugiperda]|uniref:Peroxiredoxin-5 n=1 Tax=Spodoptera frugiperda TaxID=7108 RepID=A0A9R0EGI3_SPOFR|nr:peroxiredoxin-5, mitochondrial-like [Spodoptera frugiperda]
MLPTRKLILRRTGSLIKQEVIDRGAANVFTRIIRVGETLPDCVLYEDYPTNSIKLPDFLLARNVVIFAVPGAFAPGCSRTHLPGYLSVANRMKSDGVHEIICVSVNDPYVMAAWSEKYHTKGKVRMLADPSGDFVRAIGLGMNIPTLGGYRAKRFSMFTTNSVVKELNIEPDGTGLSCSLASALEYHKYFSKKERPEDDNPNKV